VIPETATCDFCGRRFSNLTGWQCRTCHRCAAAGAPDQAKLDWPDYLTALKVWLVKNRPETRRSKRAVTREYRRRASRKAEAGVLRHSAA